MAQKEQSSTTVVILGMHRSGTSLLANIVSELGVYLGEAAELHQPRYDNVLGFFENANIMALNERILSQFKGNWIKLPSFPNNWELSSQLDPIKKEARAYLEKLYSKSKLIGFKDPTTSLTIAFWEKLIQNPKYLF